MAGEWDAVTIEELDADDGVTGIEPEGTNLKAINQHLSVARGSLRRKARTAFAEISEAYAISQTGLFDALAALPNAGTTQDLYQDLRHLLSVEMLSKFYGNLAVRKGQPVGLKDRAEGYAMEAADGLPDLAQKAWNAIDSGALVLVPDVPRMPNPVVWAI